jgi:hypothetical protein
MENGTQQPGVISQHFIFIITYEWVYWANVLHNTRLEKLAMDEYSSLLDPIVNYEENDVLLILPLTLNLKTFFRMTVHKIALAKKHLAE